MTSKDHDEWLDEEESACRLLLRVQPGGDPADLPQDLPVAGLILAADIQDAGKWQEAARAWNVACMHEANSIDDLSPVLDGVLLSDMDLLRHAREILPRTAIIGFSSVSQRHDAMLAGEAGADYVVIGQMMDPAGSEPVEFIKWWNEVTVLPIAVAGLMDETIIAAAKQAGAAFILVDLAIMDASLRQGLQRIFT